MRHVVLVMALLLLPSIALADNSSQPRHRWVGIQFDVGVPDGAGFGLVFRPYVDWLRLHLVQTYNGLAGGVRGGFTFDPINFPVAPTITLEGGHSFKGKLPGVDMPAIGYDYANLHLGLEFGKRNIWRFFVHGGITWAHVITSDFQSFNGGPGSIGNPMLNLMGPSAKIGFTFYL
jgi:hypothetical protein